MLSDNGRLVSIQFNQRNVYIKCIVEKLKESLGFRYDITVFQEGLKHELIATYCNLMDKLRLAQKLYELS